MQGANEFNLARALLLSLLLRFAKLVVGKQQIIGRKSWLAVFL